MFEPIEEIQVNGVQDAENILKSIGFESADSLIEKAKWKVGDEKQYQGVTWVVGGFNANGAPLWRKKKDGGSSAAPSQSTSEKSWDKQDSFNKRGTDENKLWNLWYHHQNTGDPFHVSAMVDILKKKFPNVAEFVQTAPNTGKSTITAKDSSGNEIATIDLSGNKTSIPTLQTFMDKCSAAVKAPAKKTSSPKTNKKSGSSGIPTKEQALKKIDDFTKDYQIRSFTSDNIPYFIGNHTFRLSEKLRQEKFPWLDDIGRKGQANSIKYVIADSVSGGAKEVAKKLNESGLGPHWEAVREWPVLKLKSEDPMGNVSYITISKRSK